jgi:hypothetical protein
MTERRQRDWSELCTAVANETDSKKLVSLIQELTRALDEKNCCARAKSLFDHIREDAAGNVVPRRSGALLGRRSSITISRPQILHVRKWRNKPSCPSPPTRQRGRESASLA